MAKEECPSCGKGIGLLNMKFTKPDGSIGCGKCTTMKERYNGSKLEQEQKAEKKKTEMLNQNETIIKSFDMVQINLKAGNSPKNAWGQEIETDNSFGTLYVSNQRVFHKGQFLLKNWLIEIPLNMVGSATTKKGLISGDITITSTAGTKMELSANKKIADEITQTINNAKTQISQTSASSNNISIPDQIKKLSELKDQGILTEKEFNDKKKDLLEKM